MSTQVPVTGLVTLPDVRSVALVHSTPTHSLKADEAYVLGNNWGGGDCTLTLPALDGKTDSEGTVTQVPVIEGHTITVRCDTLPGSGYVAVRVDDPAHGSDYINTYFAVHLTQAGKEYVFTARNSQHRWSLSDESGCDPQAA